MPFIQRTLLSATPLRRFLFLVGLVLGLLETFVVSSVPFWFLLASPLSESSANLITTVTGGISIVIDPVVAFAVAFMLGRNIDVAKDYASSFLAIFLGAILGSAISAAAVILASTVVNLHLDAWAYATNGLFFYTLGALRLALVGFAGLAFSHFYRMGVVVPGQP